MRSLAILAVLLCVAATPAARPQTQPVRRTVAGELAELRALVRQLQAENAALRAEVERLRPKGEEAKPAADPRIATAMREKRIIVGMTLEQAKTVARDLGSVSGEHSVERTESQRSEE